MLKCVHCRGCAECCSCGPGHHWIECMDDEPCSTCGGCKACCDCKEGAIPLKFKDMVTHKDFPASVIQEKITKLEREIKVLKRRLNKIEENDE